MGGTDLLEGRPARLGGAGLTGLTLLLLAMALAVVVLLFAVRVTGTSMEPTLRQGDRLEVDLANRRNVARFDLVEAVQPGARESGGGTHIVKRVIGLPGDQIAVEGGADAPRVYVRPAGSTTVLAVDNPPWRDQATGGAQPCCTSDGRATGSPTWVTVPDGSYWLIGDNWSGSTDSRVFGFVRQDQIRARLVLRILPPGRFGRLTTLARLVPVDE
ncbi:signal peptidase I [Nocardioides sp. AN3]